MRSLFIIAFMFSFQVSNSQDMRKMKEIDAAVILINSSEYPTTTDTIVNDIPHLGLYMKTFASVTIHDSEVVKYSNKVFGITARNLISDTLNTLTAFYFQHGKLIKVEDSGVSKGRNIRADWYYDNGQSIYYTLENIKSDKADERAQQLLIMANAMQDQFRKRIAPEKE